MTILCPYCQEDGVWRVALRSDSSIKFRMCFECDSVWTDEQELSDKAGSRFDLHMQKLNRPVDWKDIEKLGVCESTSPVAHS